MTVTMFNVEKDAAGFPIVGKRVTIALVTNVGEPGYGADQSSIESVGEVVTDGNGRWEIDVVPNVDIVPEGTIYTAL